MNKKGLEIKSALFAIAAIGAFITAFGIIISGWANEYNSGIGFDLGEYDKLEDTNQEAEGFRRDISPSESSVDDEFESRSYKSVFGIIVNIYKPFKVVFGEGGLIDSVTDRFGLPNYVRMFIVTLMGIAIAFAIIAIIFRLPGGTT